MRPRAHTIMLDAVAQASASASAWRLETATALLWPLKDDDRLTVLINLMAAQVDTLWPKNDDQVDAIVDVLRLQLKLKAAP